MRILKSIWNSTSDKFIKNMILKNYLFHLIQLWNPKISLFLRHTEMVCNKRTQSNNSFVFKIPYTHTYIPALENNPFPTMFTKIYFKVIFIRHNTFNWIYSELYQPILSIKKMSKTSKYFKPIPRILYGIFFFLTCFMNCFKWYPLDTL